MKLRNHSSKMVGMSLLVIIATLSCNRVNFSSEQRKSDDVPVVPTGNAIKCDVYLNNNVQAVSITLPSTSNPKVVAKCTPSQVTYTWSVVKGSSPVTPNGLQGAESTPDFISLGAGTYKITLKASAQGYSDYTNASSPLTVTINGGGAANSVTCDPKINGTMTTYNYNGTNPQIAANCVPADATCTWTVTRNGTPVTISGLSTCTATADFMGQPAGNYLIYVNATRPDYNPYTTTQPLTVVVPDKPLKNVTTTKLVTNQDHYLDVQLIVDDSKSMLADNQKLASRLQGFVNDLTAAGFDWQMCVTVTRAQQLSQNDPTLYWGASRYWSGVSSTEPWILKPNSGNTFQIFQDTINAIGAGWAGTDDERAIKAAWWHLWNGDPRYNDASGCYRKDAGLAVIILSDEDERSVGGDSTQQYYAGEYKALEQDDYPQYYIDLVKEVFGAQKRFAVNSIIVRPGDTACMAQQDSEGTKSHFGVKYNELSTLSGGTVGSICDTDYSANLKYFKDNIVREMASLPLECEPVGAVNVTIDPAFSTMTRVENKTLFFDPKVPAGRTIKAEYKCAQ